MHATPCDASFEFMSRESNEGQLQTEWIFLELSLLHPSQWTIALHRHHQSSYWESEVMSP